MNKKQIKLASIVTIFILTIATIFSTKDNSFANDGQDIFLGDYIEYGIIANYINQTGDMETNFIAKKYQSNNQTTGNTISEDKANAAGDIKVGKIVDSIQTRFDPKVYEDEKYIDEVAQFLAEAQSTADMLAGRETYKCPAAADQNNYLIDITSFDESVVYVTNFENVMGSLQNGALKIKMRSNQTIVMNIDKTEFTLPRYSIEIVGDTLRKDEIAMNVIWNLYNTSNLSLQCDRLKATIVAPEAMVNIDVTGEGWLICDTIVSNGAEWHNIYRGYGQKPTSTPKAAAATAQPTSTPKVTTQPEVTSTPATTTQPTPTSTPEVTVQPTAVAGATAQPTFTSAPTATSQAIMQPTVQPVSTPEATAADVQGVTATPTSTPKSASAIATPTSESAIATSTPSVEGDQLPTQTPTKDAAQIAHPTSTPADIEKEKTQNDETVASTNKSLKNGKNANDSTQSNKAQDETSIENNEVPKDETPYSVPETGDNAQIILAILLMITSLVNGIILLIVFRKKS